MKIVYFPHPALTTKAQEVTEFNDQLRVISEKMIELMDTSNGVGLAANQVNILQRIFVMNCKQEDGSVAEVFVNPKIISQTEDVKEYKEGCLSFPSLYVEVKRPSSVTLQWQNILGEAQEKEFSGLEAVCVQHELDHLDGINFVDRISKTKKQMCLLKYSKNKNKNNK